MATILGKREIDFENTVYFLKKGEQIDIFEEADPNEEKTEEIDLSEFFDNYEKWKWGIKTDQWYMTFINAINFKVPNFVFNPEHNFLISVIPKKKGNKTYYIISGIVFAKNENEAVNKAFELKKLNREYIPFEVASEYTPYPLPISKADLRVLFNQILKELKEIKEVAFKTYKETKEVKEVATQGVQITERVLEEILTLKAETLPKLTELYLKVEKLEEKIQKIDHLEEKISQLEKKIEPSPTTPPKAKVENEKEKPERKKENLETDTIEAVLVSGAINEKGEKIALNPFANILDYIEPLTDQFLRHFGIIDETGEIEEKLKELIKQKFAKRETEITPEDVKAFIGIEISGQPWKIAVKIKQNTLKKLTEAMQKSLIGVPAVEVEKAVKCFIQKAIKHKEFNPDLLRDCFNSRYTQKVERLISFIKRISEGEKEVGNKVFALDNSLIAFALELEAKRKGKRLLIKRI
jgi:hypothetical protein